MLQKIKERFIQEEIDLIGAGYVGDLLPKGLERTPYSLTFGVRLLDGILEQITEGPTYTYFSHYRTVNAYLDRCTLLAAKILEREGYLAFSIPASQSSPEDGFSGIFSHKAAAVRAGLGYIGKSALFISDELGPRVRLGTVLTNYPFAETERSGGSCGNCMICAKACPAGAISGKEYLPGMAREDFFDAKKCSMHMKRAYQHIGRGAVCGICMAVCPRNKKNSKKH